MYISCNMTCIYICIIIDHTMRKHVVKTATVVDENGVFANNETS